METKSFTPQDSYEQPSVKTIVIESNSAILQASGTGENGGMGGGFEE